MEKGQLSKGKYKVFILPFSMAPSPREVEAITEFAQQGGIVIADAAAGMMDDHCAWQPDGLLNDFFGIKTVSSEKRKLTSTSTVTTNADEDVVGESRTAGITGPITVTSEGTSWGLKTEDLGGLQAVEVGVNEGAGKALVKVDETEAVIVRPVGQGWAIYLNALLDRYPSLRQENYGSSYRRLIDVLLAHLNLRPAVEVLSAGGQQLTQAQIVRYGLGGDQVLAIVKENIGLEGNTGKDGVTVYGDSRLGKIAKQAITIHLPERYYVYDVRSGQDFGNTSIVKTSITVGGALVLGLSRTQKFVTVTGPSSASLGEHVRFTIKLSAPGKHLVRCHFFAPNGSFMPAYQSNISLDGPTGAVVLPSALNDPAGPYRLRVTDVVTGATAEARVRLQ